MKMLLKMGVVYDNRMLFMEEMKKSGLERNVTLLSASDGETELNRRLAKSLLHSYLL